MARVPLPDLIELVKQSPDYFRKWSGETPAEQALGLTFGRPVEVATRTETFETSDGRTLVIDFDSSGAVLGIEIV